MASAARKRLLRDHTWDVRLPQMLEQAGINVAETFGVGLNPRDNRAEVRPASSSDALRPVVHA